jgi:hypothetical protein
VGGRGRARGGGAGGDFTDLQIGVCTGPVASWRVLWPHLKHYD